MPLVSAAYGRALVWAEELHRDQRRKGKPVPYISHLIAVSGLVWEDGGTEDQAIAGLLHDAIEDAGQSHASIAERFGQPVADIVLDCTVASLEHKPIASLLVAAADKAHNARDMVLDARRDAGMWSKFNAGLDGTAWYLLRIHQTLSQRLPGSRSNELLGEAVSEILASDAYRRLVPAGLAPAEWAAGYLERPEAHRSGSRAGGSSRIGP